MVVASSYAQFKICDESNCIPGVHEKCATVIRLFFGCPHTVWHVKLEAIQQRISKIACCITVFAKRKFSPNILYILLTQNNMQFSNAREIRCIANCYLCGSGESNGERRRTKVSFGRTMMRALELLQLVKRHVSGQSNVLNCEEIKAIT